MLTTFAPNGGFGGIHGRLLAGLASREGNGK